MGRYRLSCRYAISEALEKKEGSGIYGNGKPEEGSQGLWGGSIAAADGLPYCWDEEEVAGSWCGCEGAEDGGWDGDEEVAEEEEEVPGPS